MSEARHLVPGTLASNPAGLSRIAYRSGTYGTFREAMLQAIGREAHYLVDLNTRASEDPTIALIDAWAVAGDVLSFYAERIANETYVATATERRSIRALARLLDYELRPGKAAEAWLAFTLEDAVGAPLDVPLPQGLRVNSIPGPGENMVGFETAEALTAHPWLNAMRPQQQREQLPGDIAAAQSVLVQGTLSEVRQGDWLIVMDGGTPDVKRVIAVDTKTTPDATRISFADKPVPPVGFLLLPVVMAMLAPSMRQGMTTGFVSSLFAGSSASTRSAVPQRTLEADLQRRKVHPMQLRQHLARRGPETPALESGVHRLAHRAAVFGHNAPPTTPRKTPTQPNVSAMLAMGRQLILDREYPDVVPGGYAVISAPGRDDAVMTIAGVTTVTASWGALVGRATRIDFDADLTGWNDVSTRDVTVHVGSARIPLAPLPVTTPLEGSVHLLDGYYPDLAKGCFVAVEGERSDLAGVIHASVHEIADVRLIDGLTELELKSALPFPLVRAGARINGNVVRATHGESGGQPIGHGDAAKAGQSFRLPIIPLTHVGAPTEDGIAPELTIYVDHVEWTRVKSLREAGPLDRAYSLSYREDGSVVVRFGDGINGRRLPTGTNNVVARWRKGLGADGMLRAGQLSLLADKPQGVRSVTNPVAAAGAAEPATMEEARVNMGVSVLTLGKVVTLRDYADFARGFAGIEKAHAAWVWDGPGKAVFLTVAGVDGALVGQRDIDNLTAVLAEVSDRSVTVTIAPHRASWFRIEAGVRLVQGHGETQVFPAIEAALRDHFGFRRRALGQSVARSEVLAVMQGVGGVDYVDCDALYRGDTPVSGPVLVAGLPRSGRRVRDTGQPLGAELLALDPAPLDLRIIL